MGRGRRGSQLLPTGGVDPGVRAGDQLEQVVDVRGGVEAFGGHDAVEANDGAVLARLDRLLLDRGAGDRLAGRRVVAHRERDLDGELGLLLRLALELRLAARAALS